MTTKPKSEYRQAASTDKSRRAAVAQFAELAGKHGAECNVTIDHDRMLSATISLGSYRVNFSLMGGEPLDAFFGDWHVAPFTRATYSADFTLAISGTRNEYHCCKATTCESTMAKFLASIDAGLTYLALHRLDV